MTLEEVVVAADPARWRTAGFDVGEDGVARVGGVALRLAGEDAGRRIVACRVRGLGTEDVDDLPFEPAGPPSAAGRPAPDAPRHPNGVVRVDHLVAFTPDLDRTVAAGRAAGLDLRRIRDEPAPAGSPRQAFFRLGEAILEIAQAPAETRLAPDSPARFYGIALVVADLDATAAHLGDLVGEPRDAIQPGRRIATFRREAALGLPVALMT